MKTNKTKNTVSRLVGLFLVFGVLLSFTSSDVFAQIPPAATPIGNQASASYLDNGGNPQSITSNTVVTIVQQIAGVTITAGINLTVSPGGQITFPHTITNTGNGTDSFDLSNILEGSGDFNFDNIKVYKDVNGDGSPDDFTEITSTPNVSYPGNTGGLPNTYGIVIVADVPITATDGDVETFTVTVQSNFDNGETDAATNTATVDEDAVINVQKNRSVQNVAVGDTVTYTFSYAESGGNTNGSNLVIKDPLPSGVSYVEDSGVWSGASGVPLTDATGETATGITYRFDDTGAADSVIIQIANVNAGASGTVSFKVTVDEGTEGLTINNTGSFSHDDSPTPSATNPADIIVDESYSIVAIDADTVSASEVDQGAIVNFVNRFVNNGTATDTYNITRTNSNYPAGTTFTFFQADANNEPTSPFTDTGVDGIVDTGPVAVGDTVVVILQVNLPSGVSGGPYSVVKNLTSINDPAATDSHVDKLEGIKVPTVDITNNGGIATGTGVGQGPETNPVSTITTNPNNTVTFSLWITNTSAQADNYTLRFANDTTALGNLLNEGNLPAGWNASFTNPNNGNSVITSTGSLAAGDSMEVNFKITVPAGYAPGDVEFYIRALSQNTGAIDIKHERVTINTVRSISLTTPQTGSVSPGGSVDYIHTLTVNSNVTENNGTDTDFYVELANSVPTGWTARVYWDTNEDGNVTSVDSLLTSAASSGSVNLPATIGTLNFGDQVKFIVNVTASTGLEDGATVTTTITISDEGTVGLADVENDDQTEVQAGVLSIDKYQAPDVSGSPGTFTKNNFNVFPGDTVWYEIVVVNDGSQPVTSVVIQDNVPSYTKIAVEGTVTINNGTITGLTLDPGNPTVGNSGTVKVSVPTLQPTSQFTLRFAVKVDE